MRIFMAAVIAVATCSSALAISSDLVELHHGYITGNTYRDMPQREQQSYVLGVVDGMLMAPVFGAPSGIKYWGSS
jgi:hypothetical protein